MLATALRHLQRRRHYRSKKARVIQRRLARRQQSVSLFDSLPKTTYPEQPDPKANPITPPQKSETGGLYECLVDYENQLFSVSWLGTQDYPDFGNFPFIDHGNATLIQQHPDIAAIWENSALLDYGAHACVRICNDDQFPVLKLSHSDDLSLQLIQHELDALVILSGLGFHIADFNKQPFQVTGITRGYRMKRLYKLEIAEMQSRGTEIREALCDLHSAGFCHGDLNPSNIMKDGDGRITIIDFSFAGRIGDKVPSYFPSYVYPKGVYDANGDLAALDRYIGSM